MYEGGGLNTKIVRIRTVSEEEKLKQATVRIHNPRNYREIAHPTTIPRFSDGRGERRRILVAPSELEEQRGCALLAFREWLAPLAQKTSRTLIIPQRFSTLFNFSAVARAWKKSCGLKDVVHEPGYFNAKYAHLCRRNESSSFHIRIEKDWSSGKQWGPDDSLVPCTTSSSKTNGDVDMCLLLRGRTSIFQLLKLVPALNAGMPCIFITHAARGFKVSSVNKCMPPRLPHH
mgnify:CR=1 FL=1